MTRHRWQRVACWWSIGRCGNAHLMRIALAITAVAPVDDGHARFNLAANRVVYGLLDALLEFGWRLRVLAGVEKLGEPFGSRQAARVRGAKARHGASLRLARCLRAG